MAEKSSKMGVAQPPAPTVRVPVKPEDVFLEEGYELEPLVIGLTYPTSLCFDDAGNLYIGEAGYSYGPAKVEGGGRVLKLSPDGTVTEVASGFRGPMTDAQWHNGALYVAEGAFPGRITKVGPDGSKQVLIDGLRSGADHFTGDIAFGPDGDMYFGVGVMTNSAVVGVDNFLFGWLPDMPKEHDVPARQTVLRGVNYTGANPFTLQQPNPSLSVTGAFKPFGEPSRPGETIEGNFFANGVIYAMSPDGSNPRLIADGLRNPYALGFSPDGKLYAIDQGYDERGSRPINDAPEVMWEIKQGGWYGWPDYVAGIPVTDKRWQMGKGQPPIEPVLAKHPPIPGEPALLLEHHSASTGFAFSENPAFGHVGEVFIAQIGSGTPVTGREMSAAGYRVVRANLATGEVKDFLHTRKPTYGGTGPQRPITVRFDRTGESLYVLDFGTMSGNAAGAIPFASSGVLWRVRPTGKGKGA